MRGGRSRKGRVGQERLVNDRWVKVPQRLPVIAMPLYALIVTSLIHASGRCICRHACDKSPISTEKACRPGLSNYRLLVWLLEIHQYSSGSICEAKPFTFAVSRIKRLSGSCPLLSTNGLLTLLLLLIKTDCFFDFVHLENLLWWAM